MQFSKYRQLVPFEAVFSSWAFCMGWEKPCVLWRDKQKPGECCNASTPLWELCLGDEM